MASVQQEQPCRRITHVMLSKGFGGAERYFVDLCRGQAALGHSIQAICHPAFVARGLLQGQPGIELASVKAHGRWDLLARRRLRRLLAEHRPEVVHTHLARATALAGAEAAALGIAVVAKLHNYVNLDYYRHVTRFITTTEAQRRYLHDHGIDADRIEVIPNFSSLAWVDCTERSDDSRPFTWVACGRLVHKKGFDLLLEALASEPAFADDRLILGGDGAERDTLQRLAKQLGIEHQVDFAGWIDEVAPLLDGGDLFVLPSRDEPFGIAVLEAMARCLPILASRSDGPLEILDESCGWLFDCDDAQALAAAMRSARAAPEERRRRSASAVQRYRQRYHSSAVLPAISACYRTAQQAQC